MKASPVLLVSRGLVLLVAASAVFLVGHTAATARFGSKSAVDTQLWRKVSGATISSQDWVNVPGLSGQRICVASGLTATVMLDLSGANDGVDVRAVVDGALFTPRYARVDTGEDEAARNTFSLVFARGIESGGHSISIQARSVSRSDVAVHSGTLLLTYRERDGCA